MEKEKHTIRMVAKDGTAEVTYDYVIGYDEKYGCIITLKLDGGQTATFDIDQWDMFDHTPQRGWNDNI